MNATFTVAAAGAGALTYQWRRDGLDVPGATESTVVVPTATRGDEGFYSVAITDSSGTTTSSSARLAVVPTSYPINIAVSAKADIHLESADTVKVQVIVPLPDGAALVGGAIASANGEPHSLILRLRADGSIDPGFAAPKIDGDSVNSIVLLPDGRITIAGTFSRVDGAMRRNLARLNADGSFDPGLNPALPPSASISAAAVQRNGKIVVATVGNNDTAVRLNSDGSIDQALVAGPNGNSLVAVTADDKILVYYEDSAARANVLRFNSDGTSDDSFQTGGPVPVRATTMAVDSAGRLYLAGNGLVSNGVTYEPLLRLRADGSRDESFSPRLTGSGRVGSVFGLFIQNDGNVLVGGSFDAVDGFGTRNVARLNESGRGVTFFDTDLGANSDAVAQLSGGTILAGLEAGTFAVGTPIRAGLVRYKADTLFDSRFDLKLRGPGHPTTVVPLASGKFVVFGLFDHAGNVTTAGRVRLNQDGSVDATFHPTQTITPELNAVTGAIELPDGRMLIVGPFTSFGGTARHGVAMLNSDGSLDGTFNPPALFDTPIAVCAMPANRFAIAGKNGTLTGGVAVVQRNGALDPNFGIHVGLDWPPSRVAALADGSLVVAGAFQSYNGQPAQGLLRFQADGTATAMVDPQPISSFAFDLALGPDGRLYAAGAIALPGRGTVSVARFNRDGTLDSTYAPSIADSPTSIVIQPDGKVIARGAVRDSDGVHLYRLDTTGMLDRTFAPDAIPAPSTGPLTAQTLALRDDGQLLLSDGGTFWGQLYSTCAATAPTITTAPADATIQPGGNATLTVTADSGPFASYQWQLNGVSIAGATNRSYTISGFSATDIGNYTVVVANAYGSATASAVLTAPRLTTGHLVNLSIRALAGGSSGRLIVGYALGGANTGGAKPILLRGVGPTLAAYGVKGAMPDPQMELYNSGQTLIDQNDDWRGVFPFDSIGAFPFLGTAPKDAAIYLPAAPSGTTSFHVLGKADAQGVVLAEAYDTTPGDRFTVLTPRFINGSARSNVGVGDNALILGFVVAGDSSERVLVRAVGPTLGAAPYNVPGVVADPKLEVYDGADAMIASNDNWGDNGAAPDLAARFAAVAAFPLTDGSKDAALSLQLPPGRYSAVVRGVGGATGQALVELYEESP